jgi:N-acetylmuramoyl-L-alanine amidase
MTFLLYLGKVMLYSGILLGYYWLFLRNRRFHHYNRFYLQATLLLSVILPFIRIPVWNSPQNSVSQAVYETLAVLTVNYGEEDAAAAGPGVLARLFTVENTLYLVYGVCIVVLLWSLVRSLLYIKRISKQYPFERIGGLKFFTTHEPGTPFSFFRSIFWNKDLPFNSRDGQQIFRHELFHVEQKHSSDIILSSIVTAFFWYNPFFYLLKKELKAIHEFLADQYAISDNDRYAYAELLVLQTLKANHNPITNYFFQNHIKRRIAMITNNHSTRLSYRSRLLALPVLAFLFCTIALYAQRSSTNSVTRTNYTGGDQKPLTVVIDAGHGGSDNGAASPDGKYLEKNLALQISQKIQQLAPSYNVNVIMTRTNDDLPGNTTVKEDGLKARTALTEKAKADLFISIHISSTGGQTDVNPDNGFEVWVSNKNDNSNTQLSKQLGTAVVQELSKIYQTYQTLKQRTTNLWVLEQSPCPALLIECGFIDNDKDVAYISNSTNQETIAKKILEGIVSYKNKPAAAVSKPATTEQPVAQAIPVENTKQSANAMPASKAIPEKVTIAPQPSLIEATGTIGDSVLFKIGVHYRRNARYPKQALANNMEGVVYFSLSVDKNGEITDFRFYDEMPPEAHKITNLTTVSLAAETIPAINKPLTKEEMKKVLQEEVKKVFEKKPNLTNREIIPSQMYFQVNFHLQKKQTPTV